MEVIAISTMPIGMLGFIFGLIAFTKVVRLEAEVERLRQQSDDNGKAEPENSVR